MRKRAKYGPVATEWPRSSRPTPLHLVSAGVERRIHECADALALDVVDG